MQLEQYLISPNETIETAIEQLNRRGTQILLAVDEHRRLLGTVTDGDIRRAILQRIPPTACISAVMQHNPMTAHEDWSPQKAQSLMFAKKVHQIPIVDNQNRVTGVFTEESLISQERLPNTAVLMVGGLGTRLGAMTANCPKPMLKPAAR